MHRSQLLPLAISSALVLAATLSPSVADSSPLPASAESNRLVSPRHIALDIGVTKSSSKRLAPGLSDAGEPRFDVPLFSVDGLGQGDTSPRPSIAVGRSLIGQVINNRQGGTLAFFDKRNGTIVGDPIGLASFNCGTDLQGFQGQTIYYDAGAGRWLVMFGRPLGTSFDPDRGCFLISATSDPLAGGWTLYEFEDDAVSFPTLAMWEGAYLVRYSSENREKTLAWERAPMLQGLPTRTTLTRLPPSTSTFISMQPADLDGLSHPPAGAPIIYLHAYDDEAFVSTPDPLKDAVDLWISEIDFDQPSSGNLSFLARIAINEFATFGQAIEAPDGTLFSSFPIITASPKYRNVGSVESLVTTFPFREEPYVDSSVGVRWIELRRSPGGEWTLHQEGSWIQEAESHLSPNIASDRFGNLAIAAQAVGPTTYPGLQYAGRRASDPLGVLSSSDLPLASGTSVSIGTNLDHTMVVVDPIDDCTFYLTGQHDQSSVASTRIASVQFADCEQLLFSDGFESGNTSLWSTQIGDI